MSTRDRPSAAHAYQVGDLRVNVVEQRVWREGVEIVLPRLSFELLLALVEAAPALMTTEQLLDRVWAGLVVNPETVAQRVKLLRTALGDEARAPRYLQVLRGRGYRMAAPVMRVDGAVELPAALPEPAETVRPAAATGTSNWRRVWPLLAAVVAIGVALAWWALAQREAAGTVSPAEQAAVERSIAVLPFENLGAMADDNVLSRGMADTVLHRLESLQNLTVIARRSSFGLADKGLDARRIGAMLSTRYILEGSVQRVGSQLRVTAQLVDTRTGDQVWSLQFDRSTRDIFAVQDEIAVKVTQALELSLDTRRSEQLTARGTSNFDAYFEFLQARSLLQGERVVDLRRALQHLERAIRLDGTFTEAMVDLADAELRIAEFEMGSDRRARLEEAAARARALIDRAIEIDPQNGHAWLQRAYLNAFTDLDLAEADYRKGLALAPSAASGYEGLAAVLYQDPERHDDALAALDRARRLDPLEPRYDVTKAVFLLYSRGDAANAEAILQQVTEQHPQYAPAVVRLGEVKVFKGELAEGIRYLELGLSLDASAEMPRRQLLNLYLDVGDVAAAGSVLRESSGTVPARQLPLLLHDRKWRAAGETAYAGLADDTVIAFDEDLVALALRRHAQATGEIDDALATLEQLARINWSEDGDPVLMDSLDRKSTLSGIAELLLASGEKMRGQRLLRAMLAQIERDEQTERSSAWNLYARAQALAMLGDAPGAIEALQKALDAGRLDKHWLYLDCDPVFESLRDRPEFKAMVAATQVAVRRQRQRLEQMRREGLVPLRT